LISKEMTGTATTSFYSGLSVARQEATHTLGRALLFKSWAKYRSRITDFALVSHRLFYLIASEPIQVTEPSLTLHEVTRQTERPVRQ
jgi:hypothetical protein